MRLDQIRKTSCSKRKFDIYKIYIYIDRNQIGFRGCKHIAEGKVILEDLELYDNLT